MAEREPDSASESIPSDGRYRKRQIALWAGLGVLFLLSYAWTFVDLLGVWIINERVILGLVVLAGGVYLIWDRRLEVVASAGEPSRWGLVVLLGSLVLLFLGVRAGIVFLGSKTGVFIRGIAMLSFFVGCVLLFLGKGAMRPLWLPVILLVFMFPESYLTSFWVPLRLQTLAAAISEKVLSALGNVTLRRGHIVETAGFAANVEEACSGIRSLMSVIPCAIFISAYGLRTPAPRIALVVLAIPITILANVFRVVMTVLLGTYVGPAAAKGFFHYFTGIGIFLACLMMLLVLLKLLQVVEETAGPSNGENPVEVSDEKRNRFWELVCSPYPQATVAAVLMFAVLYQGFEIYRIRAAWRHYPEKPFARVPMEIDGWRGWDLPSETSLADIRGTGDWLYRGYEASGRPPVNVLLMYWPPVTGSFGQRRSHSPEACYKAGGFRLLSEKSFVLQLDCAGLKAVALTAYVFEGVREKLIVTSWYQVGRMPKERAEQSESYVRRGLIALRKLLFFKSSLEPEVSCQLASSLDRPTSACVVAGSANRGSAPLA